MYLRKSPVFTGEIQEDPEHLKSFINRRYGSENPRGVSLETVAISNATDSDSDRAKRALIQFFEVWAVLRLSRRLPRQGVPTIPEDSSRVAIASGLFALFL